MGNEKITELEVIHTKDVTDFYGTMKVLEYSKKQKALYSHNGLVAFIDGIKAKLVMNHLDDIEITAFKEFLRQNNFDVGGYRISELKAKYL